MRTKVLIQTRHIKMILITLAFFFAAAATAWNEASATTLKTGDSAPTITLFDLKGEEVVLPSHFRGKVLIVHFWASWCSYCSKEMETLNSLYGKYREKGLVPFSINIGQKKEDVTGYIANMKLSYHILLDPSATAAQIYGVSAPPMTFIIDRSGTIRFRILGEVSGRGLERLLMPLLKH